MNMNATGRALTVINSLTAAGGVLVLAMSLWPGYASGCGVLLAYPHIGALGLAWLAVAVLRFSLPAAGPAKRPRLRTLLVAPLIVCTT
jgi:hypothetical protein